MWMGKEEVGISFDAGSNHTFITWDYAAWRKLKKIGCSIPVIGFGIPNVEVGNLYEVPLQASGKRKITVNAMVVAAIL
jgi:hypothetical protein